MALERTPEAMQQRFDVEVTEHISGPGQLPAQTVQQRTAVTGINSSRRFAIDTYLPNVELSIPSHPSPTFKMPTNPEQV